MSETPETEQLRNPFEMPPGPARRQLMQEQGANIGRADYTDVEWSAFEVESAQIRTAFDDLRTE